MQFLLFTLLLTSVSATPILRRDSTPSIAVIDQELNRVVLVPATSSSSSKRDLALPVVDASSNRIVEHAGAAATRLRARDLSPAIPVVDQDLNRVVLVSGTTTNSNTKRDLAVPVVDAVAGSGRVVEHAGAANDKRGLTGIVPVVVGGKVVAVDMTAENIVA